MAKANLTVAEQIEMLSRLKQAAVAHLIGKTPGRVSQMQAFHRNKDGTYDAQKFVIWYFSRGPDVDPEFSPEASPELDEYRKRLLQERIVEAQRNNARDAKQLWDISEATQVLQVFCDSVRRAAERIGQKYGADAQREILQAIDDSERRAIEAFGEPDPDLAASGEVPPGAIAVPDSPTDKQVG